MMAQARDLGFRVVLDSTVIVALVGGAFWLNSRIAVMEERIDAMRLGQVTEARIVRIEEQQRALVEKVNESNGLLRELLARQPRR